MEPASLPPGRSLLAAPRVLRGGGARVLSALGTLGLVPGGELGTSGDRDERAGRRATETLRGREVLRDFSGWLLERSNVKLTVSGHPIDHLGCSFFFLYLWENAQFRWGRRKTGIAKKKTHTLSI